MASSLRKNLHFVYFSSMVCHFGHFVSCYLQVKLRNLALKMSNDGKKIAFSFSKVKKTALVNKINTEPKDKIEYVDCFDGSEGKFSYKGHIRIDETQKPELVIPMPISRTSTDIVKSRIEEKINKTLELNKNKAEKDKPCDTKGGESPQPQNLETLAALEILNELNNGDINDKPKSKLVIEAKEVTHEASENDIDYDNIPVTDFGLAMLRGMGWRPDMGIGKEPRLVEAVSPKLRPKGLGLGAKPASETNKDKKVEDEKTKVPTSEKKSHKH